MVPFESVWPRVSALVATAERPSRYINHEWGCTYKPDAAFRFCMVYPDTYELGQSNQAVRILVNAVNACEGMAAERGFLPAPEMCDALREAGLPMFSVESCAPLAAFDVIGITLPHELAATNVLEAIDLAGLPVKAQDRAEDDPFVVGGGPCAFNPEPYAPFFDAIDIGEGEVSLPEGLSLIKKKKEQGATRAEVLRALADLPGWYVPSLYRWRDEDQAQEAGCWIEPVSADLPTVIEKQLFAGFAESSGWEPCIVPFTECVHDRLNVEILRGCARGCRFCQAGMMYRPVRERSADNVVSSVLTGLAATGYDEVSLTSLSTTDHSQIRSILTQLNGALAQTGTRVSIPSQRLDSFGVDMAGLVAGQKKGSLTFAPEAGTQRLRDVINKNVTEEDLFGAIDAAFAAGWRSCKLYFMIGLPTETDDDIKGIASLVQRAYDRARNAVEPALRGAVRISASVALFVPKAQTPFQWDGQIAPEEALRRVNLLRHSVKYRAIDIRWHDPATSFVEAVMSRSGREAAALVEEAWRRGARFDAWTECFDEQAWRDAAAALDFDVEVVAQTSWPTSRIMPWEHISTGASRKWLVREREKANREQTTPDCTFGNCSGCGACQALGVDNMLAGERVLPVRASIEQGGAAASHDGETVGSPAGSAASRGGEGGERA
ncbi:MAG: TIGR03960 family B12-binding radical SAM protein [Eggerthellaceae bacterium]|nr:TIGR03960 family B12-binding radical SAM protein [Eggerthellaceae bacterium]